jgi:hypothetical protein
VMIGTTNAAELVPGKLLKLLHPGLTRFCL